MAINKEALRFFLLVYETRKAEGKLKTDGFGELVDSMKERLELETELDAYIRKKIELMKQRPEVMEEVRKMMRAK